MKITQAFRFEAAHWLPGVAVEHRCHRLHGHSYRVELRLEGEIDPKTGFVIDFFEVEKEFKPLMGLMDHNCLNDIPGLDNPTAENIAMWIWERMTSSLPQLCAVRVYETPECWAEYEGS